MKDTTPAPAQRIALPAKSRVLLENLVRERERIAGMIDAALGGVRTALDVPDTWVLNDLERGFEPPQGEEGTSGHSRQ